MLGMVTAWTHILSNYITLYIVLVTVQSNGKVRKVTDTK